jgi:hypothetical protein
VKKILRLPAEAGAIRASQEHLQMKNVTFENLVANYTRIGDAGVASAGASSGVL